jgi:hypothetical protein
VVFKDFLQLERSILNPRIAFNHPGEQIMQSTMNGRKRPSLSEQIQRLDSILDGLAENLNAAVADAVKAAVAVAVKEAVEAVLMEVVTNPQLMRRLLPVTPPAVHPKMQGDSPSFQLRVRQRLGQAWNWFRSHLSSAGYKVSTYAHATCYRCTFRAKQSYHRLGGMVQRLRVVALFWRPLLIAISIGVTLGVLAYLAGPWLSAVASGVGGFAGTLAVQAGLWLRRMLQGSPFLDAWVAE